MVMLGDDKSIDPEGVKEELRTEWILLNGALKDIRQNYQAYFDWRIRYIWFFCFYGKASYSHLWHHRI